MPDRLWNKGRTRTRKPYRPRRRGVGEQSKLTLWVTRCVLACMFVFMAWVGSRFGPVREYLQYVFVPGAASQSPWAVWLDWQPTGDTVQPVWVAITGRQDTLEYDLPVDGEIAQPYGWTNLATYSEGVSLVASPGDMVKAVLGGKVVAVDHLIGEVVLDHGSEMRTTYRGCSNITVKVGDRVKQKDVFARVGPEGELFFGLSQAGKTLDPLTRVRSLGAR